MNYYELLKDYIKKSGLSLAEISEALKEHNYQVSKGYISQLQNGKTEAPATPELNRALAKVTGGDAEELLTAALIEKAPPEIKDKFEKLAKLKKLQNEYTQAKEVFEIRDSKASFLTSEIVKVPLYEDIISGLQNSDELIKGVEYVKASSLLGLNPFALKVNGDNMIGDNITDGDIVICVETNETTTSDIVVVAVDNGNATLNRLNCQNEICMLIPSNPKIQPSMVENKRVQLIGKVIEVRRRL